MENSNLEKIKEIVQEFFKKTSFDLEVDVFTPDNGTIPIKVRTEDPKVLIGQNGQTLSEIQHLLKAILRHQIDEPFYIDVDINGYKEKKIHYLKETARALADEAVSSASEKTFSPMSSYERRIVHMELADREDVETESVGDGLDRRIIVKPK